MATHGEILLKEETVVGLLLAAAKCDRLPARPWPLAAACETLSRSRATVDEVLQTAACSVSQPTGTDECERWMLGLYLHGHVRPVGRGIAATWVVQPAWRDQWAVAIDCLEPSEREAFDEAGQTLTRCLSIWEKTVLAASLAVDAVTS